MTQDFKPTSGSAGEVSPNAYIAKVPEIVAEIVQNERAGSAAGLVDPFYDCGWKFVGMGDDGHGYVLRSPGGDFVARIGSDFVPSVAATLLAQENSGNPWFPDIVCHGPMPCSDALRYVTVTPFLSHDTSGKIGQITNFLGDDSPGAQKVTAEMRAKLLADADFISASRQIFIVADGLSRKFLDIYPGFDAFVENMMLREDGQPVFTDPFKSNNQRNTYSDYQDSAVDKARLQLGLPVLQQPDESARIWTTHAHDVQELQAFIGQVISGAQADRAVSPYGAASRPSYTMAPRAQRPAAVLHWS